MGHDSGDSEIGKTARADATIATYAMHDEVESGALKITNLAVVAKQVESERDVWEDGKYVKKPHTFTFYRYVETTEAAA